MHEHANIIMYLVLHTRARIIA